MFTPRLDVHQLVLCREVSNNIKPAVSHHRSSTKPSRSSPANRAAEWSVSPRCLAPCLQTLHGLVAFHLMTLHPVKSPAGLHNKTNADMPLCMQQSINRRSAGAAKQPAGDCSTLAEATACKRLHRSVTQSTCPCPHELLQSMCWYCPCCNACHGIAHHHQHWQLQNKCATIMQLPSLADLLKTISNACRRVHKGHDLASKFPRADLCSWKCHCGHAQ